VIVDAGIENDLKEMGDSEKKEMKEGLGVKDDGLGLDYFISEKDEVKIIDIPASHQLGYVAMVIGANHATKKMPTAKLQSLCKKINYPIILLGGKDETIEGQSIASLDPIKIYNACGKFSLNESADLIKRSKLVVSHDTGLQYIACAFNKDVIAIWGGTSPKLAVEPYYGSNYKINMDYPKYENIVLMHDYFILDHDWYNGFCKFGNDFDICVNKIITKDGNRFRDYSIAPLVPDWFPNKRLLPYDYILDSKRNRLCYISGGFYIIKKVIALKYPLNENITKDAPAEDILLSNNLTDNNILIKVNVHSITRLQKYKEQMEWEKELNNDEFKLFTSISDELIFEWIDSQRKWLSNFFKVKNVYILLSCLNLLFYVVN
jgi:hypothetical protein